MNYKLAPSSFSFLYEGCKRCFYLKVVHNISQPSKPLPGVFSKMAGLLKNHYDGKHTKELHQGLPYGIISHGEKRVQSKAIKLAGHRHTCHVFGRFDIAVSFEDNTYGVIDFKTGSPKEEQLSLYSRQLHAYAYALENPEIGALKLFPITKLGLLYFYPERTKQNSIEQLLYEANIQWIEIPKDNDSFLSFIDEVMAVLESPVPPQPSPDCEWCNYLAKLEKYSKILA